MKSQSGFAMLWALIFLPIGVFCVCALMYLSAWMQPQEMTLQICRSNLLEGIAGVGEGLKEFLELNAQVIELRQARTQAELELKIAVASADEGAIAAAEEQLNLVISEQESLREEQYSKLGNLNVRLQELQRNTQMKIQMHQQSWSQQTQGHFVYEGKNNFTPVPRLAVKATESPDSGPPTYELQNDFMNAQALHVSWQHRIQSQQKGENTWHLNSMNQQSECAASLKPIGSGFQAVLFAGRS